MSRRCELTGKSAQVGHKVSHSNIKTKRRFLPNLLNVTLISDSLGRQVRLRISAHALRSVDHRGARRRIVAAGARSQAPGRQEARTGNLTASGPYGRSRRERVRWIGSIRPAQGGQNRLPQPRIICA